ncbi:MAG: hypothetical protein WCV81_02520 [Microgenomates group bacterium]|jgi:hypothetical protein
MSAENTNKCAISPETYGLMPDGTLPPVAKRTSRLILPTGLLMLVCVGILGVSQMKNVSAQGNINDIKPTPESTACAQVITRAKNRVTNIIRCFSDACFDRIEWEEMPSDSGCDESTTHKIFVPRVNNQYQEPDDYPEVGPQPDQPRTIIPIGN